MPLSHGLTFDLFIIDHDSCYGRLKLLGHLRRLPHRKGLRIILISLHDIAEEARAAGADAFLRKPNNLIDLVDTIRRPRGETCAG